MQYLISYNQSPGERYSTVDNMNDRARRVLQAYGLEIEGEEGGTNFVTGTSDQSFVVKGAYATVKAAADALSIELGREVGMEGR
jgi:hypothetical protein